MSSYRKRAEKLIAEVAAIMADWPAEPADDGCSFSNGHGYIQLSEALVTKTRDALLDVAAREHAGYDIAQDWIVKTRTGEAHLSWMGRLLGDAGPVAVSRAWYRLMCVDARWRWWGQPYYAANPNKGDQIELGGAK